MFSTGALPRIAGLRTRRLSSGIRVLVQRPLIMGLADPAKVTARGGVKSSSLLRCAPFLRPVFAIDTRVRQCYKIGQ